MLLSSSERDDLVERVARRLAHVPVRRDVIRDAVDRTLGAIARESGGAAAAVVDPASMDAEEGVAVVAAISMPDLASRLRGALEGMGGVVSGLGTATAGRYTVVTLRLPLAAAEQVRAAAVTLGARFSWRGEGR